MLQKQLYSQKAITHWGGYVLITDRYSGMILEISSNAISIEENKTADCIHTYLCDIAVTVHECNGVSDHDCRFNRLWS